MERERILNAGLLLLIAVASAAVYSYNYSRVAPPPGPVECGNVTLPVPGGDYTFNYTLVRGPAGVDYVSYWFKLEEGCEAVRGTATAWSGGRSVNTVAWQSPPHLNPLMHPQAGADVIEVNTYPLPPYTGLALVTYNRVNASLVGVGVLQTDYGAVPVYVYDASVLRVTQTGFALEAYKLYYDVGSGGLVGVDFYSRDLLTNIITFNYTLMLSDLIAPSPGEGTGLRDPDQSLVMVASAGVIGGAALALALAEALGAGRRR